MFRIPSVVFFSVLLSVFLLYTHTLSYGYVYLDDTLLLEKSTQFLSDIRNIGRALTEEVFSGADRTDGIFYRPVLTLSFFLDTFVFGGSATGYRISSLILHILVSLLVYVLLRFFSLSAASALLLTVFFTVHPMVVQTVVWLPGRNDLLLAVFSLLSFLLYAIHQKGNRSMVCAGHCVSFFLAVFTKETALVLPVLCIAYTVMTGKRRTPLSWGILGFSWVASGVLLLFLRNRFVPNAGSYSIPDMIGNVFVQLPGILVYIGKIIVPFQLSVYPDLAQSSLIPGGIALIAVSLAIMRSKRKDRRLIFFGCLWFFLFLLPTFMLKEAYSSGILREHRAYIPFIGFLLVIGQIDVIREWSPGKNGARWLLAVLVVLYGIRAFAHTFVFADRLVFWQNAVATSPKSPVARLNAGAAYEHLGANDDAIREYTAAIALEPRLIGIHNNVGVIYLKQQRYGEAKKAFEKELEYHPDFDIAKRNLQRVCDAHPCE